MTSSSLLAFADAAIDTFCAPQTRDTAPRDLAILGSAIALWIGLFGLDRPSVRPKPVRRKSARLL